jgi:hypothetical protein
MAALMIMLPGPHSDLRAAQTEQHPCAFRMVSSRLDRVRTRGADMARVTKAAPICLLPK